MPYIPKDVLESLKAAADSVASQTGNYLEDADFLARTLNELSQGEPEPVREMVRKLDSRRPGTSGYVPQTPEIMAIMGNLSPLVSWNVFDKGTDAYGVISIELKTTFHLERELL